MVFEVPPNLVEHSKTNKLRSMGNERLNRVGRRYECVCIESFKDECRKCQFTWTSWAGTMWITYALHIAALHVVYFLPGSMDQQSYLVVAHEVHALLGAPSGNEM